VIHFGVEKVAFEKNVVGASMKFMVPRYFEWEHWCRSPALQSRCVRSESLTNTSYFEVKRKNGCLFIQVRQIAKMSAAL
jgi:hypothetical protein